jgi:TonB family protein
MRTLVLAVLMASAASSSASAETPAEDQSIKGWFKGWGEIDASGRLKSFAPDGKANPALAQALREELQGVAFAPARIDAGATIRTYLDGGYRLVEDGEGYVLQVTSINAGPKVITRDMPRPPHRLLMLDEGSWVRASFVVDRSGKPKDVEIEDSGGAAELRRNVRASMLLWRFEPESVAGAPMETRLRQEFVFNAAGKQAPTLPACPADESGRVLAPAQALCGHPMEVEMGEPQMGHTISAP